MVVEYEEFLWAGPEGPLGPGRVARRLPYQELSLLPMRCYQFHGG